MSHTTVTHTYGIASGNLHAKKVISVSNHNHEISYMMYETHPLHSCNECKKSPILLGYRCDQCDYDMCIECAPKSAFK